MSEFLRRGDLVAQVWFSAEDNLIVGKLVGIPDSVTFHGKTVAELHEAFGEAVDDYLAFCKKVGKKAKSYTGSFNVRVQPELHLKASLLAENHHTSLNSIVMEAIKEKVNRELNNVAA